MTDVKLTAILLSIWMGFSLLFFTKSLSSYYDELINLRKESKDELRSYIFRLRVYIFVVSLIGLSGVFTLVMLIGFQQFKGPTFAIGLYSGVALFVLTYFIGRRP